MRSTRGSLLATGTAALAGLLFGFDTAVIAGTTADLTRQFALTPLTLGFTVSCALWGTVLGGLFAALPAERLGGRESLRVTAILYLISAIGCALSQHWYPFLAFRLISGLAIGGSSVFAPMYIAEISPPEVRGNRVACFQLSIVTGILLAYASNLLVETLHLGTSQWRVELAVAALPAILFYGVLGGIPRSPRWLVKRGLIAEARQALTRIGTPDVEGELEHLLQDLRSHASRTKESLFALAYRRPLLIAIAMGVFNQFTGVNAVLYYLNGIFLRAGFNGISAGRQSVVVGLANLVFTALAMTLIDRLGRKPLLLIGAAGCCATLSGIAAIFLSGKGNAFLLLLLVAFIACFALSQGAVIWVYLSEIFPNSIRERGQGFATFWLWLLTAIVAGGFPRIAAISNGYPFVIFAAMMVIQFFVVLLFFPETKGLRLEEPAG